MVLNSPRPISHANAASPPVVPVVPVKGAELNQSRSDSQEGAGAESQKGAKDSSQPAAQTKSAAAQQTSAGALLGSPETAATAKLAEPATLALPADVSRAPASRGKLPPSIAAWLQKSGVPTSNNAQAPSTPLAPNQLAQLANQLAQAGASLEVVADLGQGKAQVALPGGTTLVVQMPEVAFGVEPGMRVNLRQGGLLVPADLARHEALLGRPVSVPTTPAANGAFPASELVYPRASTDARGASPLLSDGRVVEARVVSTGPGGAVTLGVGRNQLAAASSAQFRVGDQVQLEGLKLENGELALRVVQNTGSQPPEWWGTLRSAVTESRPLGQVLSTLAARIRANLSSLPSGQPGQPAGLPGGGALPTHAQVLEQLGNALGAHAFDPENTSAAALRDLFAQGGGRLEVHLARALLGGSDGEAAITRTLGDLKGELLRALRDLPDGPLRESVARALASVEAEQLINIARSRAGESMVWSLPIPDGQGWTTARLWVDPEGQNDDSDDGKKSGGGRRRLTLSVNLSALGPVRADVISNEERTLVRVLVARPELALRFRQDAEVLGELLQRGDRRIDLAVRVGSLVELSPESELLDLPSFYRRRLTDVIA